MKIILLGLVISMSFNALAFEKRTYTKINSSEAQVKIETEQKDFTQVENYLDGLENTKFIQDMLNDKKSILFKLISEIEIENCHQPVIANKLLTGDCGEVTLTKEVRTSFGVSNDMSGGGTYTFFVGFTNAGSGKYFDVSHMVTISERAEAQTLKDGRYSGVVLKSLYLVKIKSIEEHSPLN